MEVGHNPICAQQSSFRIAPVWFPGSRRFHLPKASAWRQWSEQAVSRKTSGGTPATATHKVPRKARKKIPTEKPRNRGKERPSIYRRLIQQESSNLLIVTNVDNG